MLLAWQWHRARQGWQSCPPAAGEPSAPSLAEVRSHLYLYLALQMGNMSNASVFVSTLSEREDLIFGTLYLVFGKEGCAVLPLSLLQAAQAPARDTQAFCSHCCSQKWSLISRIIQLVLPTSALPTLFKG